MRPETANLGCFSCFSFIETIESFVANVFEQPHRDSAAPSAAWDEIDLLLPFGQGKLAMLLRQAGHAPLPRQPVRAGLCPASEQLSGFQHDLRHHGRPKMPR